MTVLPPAAVPPTDAVATRRLAIRVRRVPGAPVVAARAWLRGGARCEEIPGQALVTGRMLVEGTGRRSWREIADAAEDRGASLHSHGSTETIGVAVDALAADWERALEDLAETLLEPAFPEERCDWIRRQAAAELESLFDQPEMRAAQSFAEQLYHPHPYARPLHGDAASLGRLGREDCVRFHRASLGWGGFVVVTGDVDEAAVAHRVGELFADLRGTGEAPPVPAAPLGLGPAHREVEAGESDQAHLYVGHLTVPRHDPDTFALALVAVVLGAGAGLAGRLPERVREREGLAYAVEVATTAGAGLDPGRLVVYAGTSPATVAQAERACREELERLVEGGVEADELEEARAYLVGRDPLGRQTARQWAGILADAELYGIPRDRPEWVVERLRSVTAEEVAAAVRRSIRPGDLRVTVGLPRPDSR